MLNENVLCIIKQTVTDTLSELKRQNLICKNRQTPFQKVEMLLYNYNNFVMAIKEKEERIEELKEYGVRKKSSSISSFSGGDSFVEVKSETEKADEQIESIEASINVTRNCIKIVDDALNSLRNDPYFDIIKMKYFDQCSREEIAEHFEVDVKTVTRNKNRLINLLQIKLFTDQVILQLFVS